MVIKVGINGFGRIGRVIARVCLEHTDLQLSAINDPAISVEYIGYLIKFDSTHGKLKRNITPTDNEIRVDDIIIKIYHEKLPENVPWHNTDVQYVVEASGMFTNLAKASGHLTSDGVKRVIVTAPSVDVPMIILGVNDNTLGTEQNVISCASSTLYCLAPIIKVLEDNFGVSEGFITSIHAMTPSLKPLDGLCLRGKHWRDHRSIVQNIIPATTGACKALGKIIPTMKDKLTGLAFRVPIVNVSVLDLTVRLNSCTTLSEIVKCIAKASQNTLKNVLKISNEEAVSSDFIGETHSCIFDEASSIQLKPNFFKIICWYENEYSYACRVVDSIMFSENQFCNATTVTPRLRSLLKQDVTQQTECYMKEISVSCCSHKSQVTKLPCSAQEKLPKQLMKTQLSSEICSSSPKNTKRNTELFKIWNDTSHISKPTVKQNMNSIFQSCITIANTEPPKRIETTIAQTRLENVKKEFTKMVNMTEDLLKKTHSNQSEVHILSKSEFTNKSDSKFRQKDKFFIAETERYKKTENDPVENCGDYKSLTQNLEEELSCYSYENEVSDFDVSQKVGEMHIEETKLKNSTPYSEEERQLEGKEAFGDALQHDEFKEQVSKTINTLIEGLTTHNTQYLPKDPVVTLSNAGKKKTFTKQIQNAKAPTKSFKSLVNESNVQNKKVSEIMDTTLKFDEKVDLYEKYKLNNENINMKVINHELRKRNIVLVNTKSEAETVSDDNDNDLMVENVKPKTKINFDRQIIDDLEENLDNVVVISECTSRCDSPENTNTTISNRIENKQDIYDKLDSASATDSENSFEVNEKKSQVIHITDLTKSFEDLARLDKICRIIEISDELSDKLFSALDKKDENELKKKKWSFKDLCERIQLDDFCNRVFGKTTA